MLLPLTAGIGLGSMITGQMVTRTGRTAVFPTYGLMVATAGLLLLAFFIPYLSTAELAWAFGVVALFMGTVMGVVQVTVQAVSGPRMLGTGAAMVQFSRSVGAAFGTATVAAVLFSILTATDRDTANLFGTIIEQGPEAIAALAPARQAIVQAEIGEAFRAAFITIAAFTGIGDMAGLVDAAAPALNGVPSIDGIAARHRTRQTPTTKSGRSAMIVDAQVHLWKANTPDRPWLPNRVAQLPRAVH